MAGYCWKWLEMARKGWKGLIWPKLTENYWKQLEIVANWSTWLKMTDSGCKQLHMSRNICKWVEMTEMANTCWKWVEMSDFS